MPHSVLRDMKLDDIRFLTDAAYLERGQLHAGQGRCPAAITDLSTALQLQPSSVRALLARSRAHLTLRNTEQALADCQQALRLDPENGQLRVLQRDIHEARLVADLAASPLRTPATRLMSSSSRAGGAGGEGEEEDPFAGLDTPKSDSAAGRGPAKLCLVCLDAARGCRLRPCMHTALCLSCASALQRRRQGCPLCGALITALEPGFFTRTYTLEDSAGLVALAALAQHPPSPTKSMLFSRSLRGSTAQAPPTPPLLPVPEREV
ncbi:hypothetical protein QJQ45_003958 [Haematococcus lacustris]|nr:hypothetical protein QJQ45_003958 [Haematococcus lacustris]